MRLLVSSLLVLVCCGGPASTPSTATPEDQRCTLRLSATSVLVDGAPSSRAAAIDTCRRTAGAVLIVEAGTPRDVVDGLEADLRHEGIHFFERGVVGDSHRHGGPIITVPPRPESSRTIVPPDASVPVPMPPRPTPPDARVIYDNHCDDNPLAPGCS